MLQPLQLTDVSIRYAEEIVELRDFLIRAGCAVRTGQALGQIADRLLRDRSFHRDLTSYVWVVIDRCDGIGYSDLLGVLAIAAAGSSFAATADVDDAHRLLRFLMDARHSLEGLSDTTERAPARGAAGAMANPLSESLQPVRGDGREVSAEPLQLAAGRDLYSAEEQQKGDRRRSWLPWVTAAACILVVLLAGLWMRARPTKNASNPTVSVAPAVAGNAASAPVTPATKESVAPSAIPPDERVARAVPHFPIARRNSRVVPSRPVVQSSRGTRPAAPYVPGLLLRPCLQL